MAKEDLLTADDTGYVAQFDVAQEAKDVGNAIDIDLPASWHALRERGGVQKGEPRVLLGLPNYNPYVIERDCYAFLSYQSCALALRDNQRFSSEAYMDYAAFRALGDSIISRVGQPHRELRGISQPKFLVQRAKDWWRTNWIESIADALLLRLESMERADLNIELCARLPIHTVIRGIGIDSQKALEFRENLLRATGMRGGTPEELKAAPGKVAGMLQEVLEARRKVPADDVISFLLHGELPEGTGSRRLTDPEILSYCQLIILAGSATTWRQLGMIIHALLTHREAWEACREDRSLIPQAVEEGARWSGTQQIFPRLCTIDTEFEGVMVPAGSRVYVCVGSANRDPARWERPDEFDIFRESKPHLGFGMGAHICLGMHVAKEEMIYAINGLLDRFPDMRPDPAFPPAQIIGALEQRGMSHVGVLLR